MATFSHPIARFAGVTDFSPSGSRLSRRRLPRSVPVVMCARPIGAHHKNIPSQRVIHRPARNATAWPTVSRAPPTTTSTATTPMRCPPSAPVRIPVPVEIGNVAGVGIAASAAMRRCGIATSTPMATRAARLPVQPFDGSQRDILGRASPVKRRGAGCSACGSLSQSSGHPLNTSQKPRGACRTP